MPDPNHVEAFRQRLHKAVSVATWDDAMVYRRLATKLDDTGEVEAFILDHTGFAKNGDHSVGVQRQYSGTLGRTANCQVATSLHLAGDHLSGCIGMRLYLPKQWVADRARRRKAQVPDDVEFREKWRVGLDLLDRGLGWVSRRVVLCRCGLRRLHRLS